ncbi:MAG: YncE family protein [Bacteroidota bacterium]
MKKIISDIIYSGLVSLLLLTSACDEDNVHPGNKFEFDSKTVFIINEGNYGYGNASLSYYERDSFKVTNGIFISANDFPLGDVPQSMIINDSLAYITVSNSGKILVFNISDFRHNATIGGFTAPRYMLFINDSLMLVSDLYEKALNVVNTHLNKITGKIPLGGPVEQMEIIDDYVYAASWSFNDMLYKINIDERRLVDSIDTGLQPNSIVKDRNNNLWVLCDGGYPGNSAGHEKARLMKIEPLSMTVLTELTFPDLSSSPSKLNINSSRDSLYYIEGKWGGGVRSEKGIFCISIEATELPQQAFIPANDNLFYGLGIDPENSDVYCSDAIDYLQKGIVFRYNSEGEKIDSFRVGVVPGEFTFKE